MKDFKKLLIWQKGVRLYVDLHISCKQLPADERYARSSRVRPAAFSIPANIAEASSKAIANHYKQFLENSLGSAYELETALITIQKIYPMRKELNYLLINFVRFKKCWFLL